MRYQFLILLPLLAACDSPTQSTEQCEPGVATMSYPNATAAVVRSTATFEDIRLTCHQNASVRPVEYRYYVSLMDPAGWSDDVPMTEWTGGEMPTIRITRHDEHWKALIWDVRSPGNSMPLARSQLNIRPR